MGGKNSGRKPKSEPVYDTGKEPWERQSFDTGKSYEAFLAYSRLGPGRTLEKAATELGRGPEYRRTLEAWSSKNGWRQRAHAWDSHQDRREREATLKAAERKASQRLGVADGLWMTAARVLRMWQKYLQQWEDLQAERQARGEPLEQPPITPTEMQRLAEAGLKLAQLLEGKPTEIGEQRHHITVDERRKRIQSIIGDKKVRTAMRAITEAVKDADTGLVH